MGKSKKKKATLDYEELFRSEPKDAWFSGLSALMLEDDPSKSHKAVAAADGMDTSEGPAKGRKKRKQQQQQGLKLQSTSMKVGRGSRTAAQKKRKADKQEKALARAEKAAVKVTRKVTRKQQVAALKTLY